MIVNDAVYGKIKFDDAIANIIETKPLQRLKHIHQGGAVFLAYPNISTSRFEHSIGVCHLIGILGGNQKEQIAGLLHDISHTAFSHVIDYVLEDKNEDFHENDIYLIAIISAVSQPHLTISYFDIARDRFTIS